jgi:hypothetical protein
MHPCREQDSVAVMDAQIADLGSRIEASLIGALIGEHAAGVAAGGADLLGVAESVAACGGFGENDLRQRGLERPSRSGSAGLLLRALPFGLLTPLDRPRLRRDAYRCVAIAGADEGTAVTSVAAAILIADVLRFDIATALVRVRQSLLEDAPMALLQRLRVMPTEAMEARASLADPGLVLQSAVTAADGAMTAEEAVNRAASGPVVALTLAGALAGARGGRRSIEGVAVAEVPHGERAISIAHHLAERAEEQLHLRTEELRRVANIES